MLSITELMYGTHSMERGSISCLMHEPKKSNSKFPKLHFYSQRFTCLPYQKLKNRDNH